MMMQREPVLIATTSAARAFPSSPDTAYPPNPFEGFESYTFQDDDLTPLSPTFLLASPASMDLAMDDYESATHHEEDQAMHYMQSLHVSIHTPQPTRLPPGGAGMLLPVPPPPALEDDDDHHKVKNKDQEQNEEGEGTEEPDEPDEPNEEAKQQKQPSPPADTAKLVEAITTSKRKLPEPDATHYPLHKASPSPEEAEREAGSQTVANAMPTPKTQATKQKVTHAGSSAGKTGSPQHRPVARISHARPVHHIPIDIVGSSYSFFPTFIQDSFPMYNAMLLRSTLLAVPGSRECQIPWVQGAITIHGKAQKEPRLSAYYADPGAAPYSYSNHKDIKPVSFADEARCPATLRELRTLASQQCGVVFDSAVLNYYRSGKDLISYHSDDSPSYGTPFDNKTIATISIGAERDFLFTHKAHDGTVQSISLPSGSMFVMEGQFQTHWKHSLPARTRVSTPRVSITFRKTLQYAAQPTKRSRKQ